MTDISYFESSDHLRAKEVQWRVAIGRFIVAFSSVEWFTFHMLAELPKERILESVMSLRFEQRVEIVIQLLGHERPDLVAKATNLLTQAKQLGKTRNLIAHNPILLNLFEDSVGVDLTHGIFKYGETQPRLTIEQLQDRCVAVEQLVKELDALREQITPL